LDDRPENAFVIPIRAPWPKDGANRNFQGILRMQKIALGILKGASSGRVAVRESAAATGPRNFVFKDAFSPMLAESILGLDSSSGVPVRWRLAREIQLRRAVYDAVVSWGERLSLTMLVQQQFARVRKPHIAMMYRLQKPNIRVPLKAFRRNLHAVVTWNSVQGRALIERLRHPAERVYLIRHYVDQVFHGPCQIEQDMIWNETARTQQMGRSARAYVEKNHTLEKFTATTRSAAEAALDGRPAPESWWE
jgi:hypothetical protein